MENTNGFLERIETIPTDKEHLRLASTPCSAPCIEASLLVLLPNGIEKK